MSDYPENDLLQSHSERFLEMAFRSDRQEVLHHPDGKGQKTGACGDTVAFYILCQDDQIHRITYDIQGCINTNACANALIDLVQGKSVDQAWEINPETVAQYLQTLPADHLHCAELAVGAFYLALADLRDTRQSPWKKPYR